MRRAAASGGSVRRLWLGWWVVSRRYPPGGSGEHRGPSASARTDATASSPTRLACARSAERRYEVTARGRAAAPRILTTASRLTTWERWIWRNCSGSSRATSSPSVVWTRWHTSGVWRIRASTSSPDSSGSAMSSSTRSLARPDRPRRRWRRCLVRATRGEHDRDRQPHAPTLASRRTPIEPIETSSFETRAMKPARIQDAGFSP